MNVSKMSDIEIKRVLCNALNQRMGANFTKFISYFLLTFSLEYSLLNTFIVSI
jgi:uncharacterized membrane protein